MPLRHRIAALVVGLGATLLGPAAPGDSPPADPGLVAAFRDTLEGRPAEFTDRPLDAAAAEREKSAAWAAYREAALDLGWDKQLIPPPPPLEKLRAMKPEARRKHAITPGTIACDGETMPYYMLVKGDFADGAWPLFFMTHGGGSTDDTLPHPHAWPVNTQDWMNQAGLIDRLLPPGLYFVPRMANDNKGRWWYRHNLTAFDHVIRRAILFRGVDPNRIYMMGVSEGGYGTEALTPFWADRFAGGCALAGGAGPGERFYCLRNTPFRNDTGERDTMFGRADLAQKNHAYLDDLKRDDPQGYDHVLDLQKGRGHAIDYAPGPAWIATKVRDPRPRKLCWYVFALDGVRRTDFSWLALSDAPADRDALIVAEADKATNTITIDARMNPPGKCESPVYGAPPLKIADREPLAGTTLVLHLDDALLDLDRPVRVTVNGAEAFSGEVTRSAAVIAATTARTGDPGRVFTARVEIPLPAAKP